LLDTLSSTSQYVGSRIKTFDFSTLYTTIPRAQLKSRIKEFIQRVSKTGFGEQKYHYLDRSYFFKSHSNSNKKYNQYLIIQMLDFFIGILFVQCGGRINKRLVFQ
jgi:hypothetical protein